MEAKFIASVCVLGALLRAFLPQSTVQLSLQKYKLKEVFNKLSNKRANEAL